MTRRIDIKENALWKLDSMLLDTLLKDKTTGRNILWGTDNYEKLGVSYKCTAQIYPELITGNNGEVIRPRVAKSLQEQTLRVKDKAEVFTPSWICNAQNNLVDEAWFGRKNVFNRESKKNWTVIPQKISFPDGKTWSDYINLNRLEVTCGEAPYLVSRYDTISGKHIPIARRIGLLDRKMRVVGENTENENEWHSFTLQAFKSCFGFEWQGDNLLLARENLLYTYIDYFKAKFKIEPELKRLLEIADIIAWNLWQMDGLKCVVPYSCHDETIVKADLIEKRTYTVPCEGCKKNDIKLHNGTYCYIMDWATGKRRKFVSLLKRNRK